MTYPAASSGARNGIDEAASGAFDGAHWSASPVVPCAHATTVRPAFGAAPVGATTTPDTAMSRPSTAREWYRTLHALAPAGAATGSLRMSVPGARFTSGDGGV